MADYFLDQTNGNDTNSGLTMDLAFLTWFYALETFSSTYNAGDNLFVRRDVTTVVTEDIDYSSGLSGAYPVLRVIGCPRASHAISSADFTQGSTAVVVDDNDMVRASHQSRYLTGPDGYQYFITRVISGSSIVLDRKYIGTTSLNAAATILADDTTYWDTVDDSAWTIKKSAWEADADTLPIMDFNDGAFQFRLNNTADVFEFYNIEFKDSADTNGIVYSSSNRQVTFTGCLFKQSASNARLLYNRGGSFFMTRCTLEGSGSGSAQIGYACTFDSSVGEFRDVAIYNCGDHGVLISGRQRWTNVNLGVEIANGDDDLKVYNALDLKGIDVRLGGSNGDVSRDFYQLRIAFENSLGVEGDSRFYYESGYYDDVAVSGETPNKKVSDNVLKFTPNNNVLFEYPMDEPVLRYKIWTDTTSYAYKFWIYNDLGVTLNDVLATDDIYLECEYEDARTGTTQYSRTRVRSSQIDILDAADADDWDYLEVTGIQLGIAGWVTLSIYVSIYNATTTFFIDPAVVIT